MYRKSIKAMCAVLISVLFISAMTVWVSAYDETQSGLIYQDTGNGSYIITGYSVYQSKMTIPAEINGIPVTALSEYVFANNANVKSLIIEAQITEIPRGAFSDCSSLTAVIIPDTVVSIGDSAFFGCSMLEKVNLPEGLVSIGAESFQGCSRLNKLTIPESVNAIGHDAFSACESLILDCVKNEYALQYAGDNNIFTDVRQSPDYMPYLILKISAVFAAVLIVIWVIIRITLKRRKK